MPGLLTEVTKARLLDLLLGGRRYVPPAVVEVGLSLEPANEAGLVVEPDHPSYRRVKVPNDLVQFPGAAFYDGVKSNARPIPFPAPSGDWGIVRSAFVAEPGGGPVVAAFDLEHPRRLGPGMPPPLIPTGALHWRFGG